MNVYYYEPLTIRLGIRVNISIASYFIIDRYRFVRISCRNAYVITKKKNNLSTSFFHTSFPFLFFSLKCKVQDVREFRSRVVLLSRALFMRNLHKCSINERRYQCTVRLTSKLNYIRTLLVDHIRIFP